MKTTSLLTEAQEIVEGDRQADYGDPLTNMECIGEVWSAILKAAGGHYTYIPTRLVPVMMCGLKLIREAHKHKRDNLKDIAGYAAVGQIVVEEQDKEDVVPEGIWTIEELEAFNSGH